jgi:hypothetical protein
VPSTEERPRGLDVPGRDQPADAGGARPISIDQHRLRDEHLEPDGTADLPQALEIPGPARAESKVGAHHDRTRAMLPDEHLLDPLRSALRRIGRIEALDERQVRARLPEQITSTADHRQRHGRTLGCQHGQRMRIERQRRHLPSVDPRAGARLREQGPMSQVHTVVVAGHDDPLRPLPHAPAPPEEPRAGSDPSVPVTPTLYPPSRVTARRKRLRPVGSG